MTGSSEFSFLDVPGSLAAGWAPSGYDKLWHYNLHYFDDLNAFDANQRTTWHTDLIEQWIAENRPGQGIGWDPYPTSLRIVNWIKWGLAGNTLSAAARQSLAVQARWLTRRMEHHLLGNHLFVNAKALVFAGLYFEGDQAEKWLRLGLRLLERELPEQVLSDGGHFELSPMYHALIMEDLLDLVNVQRAYGRDLPASWLDAASRMIEWLVAMSHPDGELSFFNDAAFGVAPVHSELRRYAEELSLAWPSEPSTIHLAASGYVRLANREVVALLDVAQIGPDYLPAHAHADTLSFELSLFGQRVIVNSGTSCYGTGPERLRQRGTAAHNTVVVDGEDSSEVWGGFRVARRARPVGLVSSGLQVRCSHDGYRRLPGRVIHTRSWALTSQSLEIVDEVDGEFRTGEARFYLHPDVAVSERDHSYLLALPDGRRATVSVEGGERRIETATWHPRFGASVPTYCLVTEFRDGSIRTTISWQPQ